MVWLFTIYSFEVYLWKTMADVCWRKITRRSLSRGKKM